MSKVKKLIVKIIVSIIMILLAIWMLVPYYWTLKTSLEGAEDVYKFPPNLMFPIPPVVENYKYVWEALDLARYYLNSIVLTVMTVVLSILVSLLAAYPLARYDFYGKKYVWIFLFIPSLIPFPGATIVNYLTIARMHLLNTYTGVVLPGLVNLFAIILFRQAYSKVPQSLEDAARIDGAGELYIWWKIMTPQIRPTIATWALFTAIVTWDSFMWPLIVLSDPKKYPLAVGLQYLNSVFQVNFRYTAAGLILATIPMILLLIFAQDYIVRGISEGGIKY